MRKLLIFTFLLSFLFAPAQAPQKLKSSEIFQKIQEINFLGSILYVGAHPDDENTSLISYFSNKENARTAYLSLTRGDGGQNLIGPEIREQLGVIRSQELLAARKIDGGEQLFTRANDFGYSKTPEETLQIWDKEEVLSDVVWAIRKFKPDIIINRFDHRTSGSTHGHHTSSAILSVEAFDLAADKNAFPEQLKYTRVFQPKRLLFNTSPWFYGSDKAFEEADKSHFLELDTGVYFPLQGLSNTEIASLSRTQHRSQGFGSTGTRGSKKEYLELIKGDFPEDEEKVFHGVNTSWSRVAGGEEIGSILHEVEREFNFKDPSQSVPKLLEAYRLIQDLEDEHWKEIKTREIKEIIAACSGLFLEAVAVETSASPGQEVPVKLEAINRSENNTRLVSVELNPNNSTIQPDVRLENNKTWVEELALKIPQSSKFTTPYWLEEEGTAGMYKVEDQELIGLPETPHYTKAIFIVSFGNTEIPFEREVVYKYNDAVLGETYQSFEIIPDVSVEFPEDVLIFNNDEPIKIEVKVASSKENVQGELSLEAGEGWEISPESTPFHIREKGATVNLEFSITPPDSQNEIQLIPRVKVKEREYSDKLVRVIYSHIPLQTLVLPSRLKLVRLDIRKKGENIAYIEGAGDVIAENLRQIGYKVTQLSPLAISEANLARFDAVVMGIRAYNTIEELKYRQNSLLNYVKNGGTLIVQYNTSRDLVTQHLAPYELKLSRDRVTEEDAQVEFLDESHPILNHPNKITQQDFDNWVQERGLYFPSQWAEDFTPLLAMNDTGEKSKKGSLLVAKYGKGYYIYTGLSFFRQFPEGVPGAYRLFTNMISIGK